MEANEIMTNEEVVETTTEEITKVSSGKGLKIALGVGVAVLVGGLAYKYAIKPAIARYKSLKNAPDDFEVDEDDGIVNVEEVVDVEEEPEN